MRSDRICSRSNSVRLNLESLEDRWVPAMVGSVNQNFIDQIYRDVLHRAPDAGAAGWVVALDTGTDRGEVVDSILNSDEGLRNQINDLYVRFLDRQADPTGLNGWVQFLRDDHSNLELASQIIASQEYYQKAGGTDFGFLNAVYQDLFGRSISFGEARDRGDDLDGGFEDRLVTAENILESDEAQDSRDRYSAQSFLGVQLRGNDASDLVSNDDNGGGDFDNDEAVFAGTLLSGDQYFRRAQTQTTANFATIPSSDNRPSQSIQ